MAILLLEGRAGLAEFTDEVVERADVQELLRRVDFVVDERAERAGFHRMTTYIDITLRDGRTISGQADFAKGSPANPMTFDEVADKFRECAAHAGLSRGRAEDVVAMVRDLEALPSIRRLTAALVIDAR